MLPVKNPRDYTLNELEALALINHSTLMLDNVLSLLEWLDSMHKMENKFIVQQELYKINHRVEENKKMPRGRPPVFDYDSIPCTLVD